MSSSASANINIEAHTAYPPSPELDTGTELHSCEHCKDFTLDFGLTDGELDEMLRNRVNGSSTAIGLDMTIIEKVRYMRNKDGNLAIFSDTKDQIVQKVNTGCRLYAFLSLAIDQQDNGGNDLLCALLFPNVSILEVYEIGTSIKFKRSFQLHVPRGKTGFIHI